MSAIKQAATSTLVTPTNSTSLPGAQPLPAQTLQVKAPVAKPPPVNVSNTTAPLPAAPSNTVNNNTSSSNTVPTKPPSVSSWFQWLLVFAVIAMIVYLFVPFPGKQPPPGTAVNWACNAQFQCGHSATGIYTSQVACTQDCTPGLYYHCSTATVSGGTGTYAWQQTYNVGTCDSDHVSQGTSYSSRGACTTGCSGSSQYVCNQIKGCSAAGNNNQYPGQTVYTNDPATNEFQITTCATDCTWYHYCAAGACIDIGYYDGANPTTNASVTDLQNNPVPVGTTLIAGACPDASCAAPNTTYTCTGPNPCATGTVNGNGQACAVVLETCCDAQKMGSPCGSQCCPMGQSCCKGANNDLAVCYSTDCGATINQDTCQITGGCSPCNVCINNTCQSNSAVCNDGCATCNPSTNTCELISGCQTCSSWDQAPPTSFLTGATCISTYCQWDANTLGPNGETNWSDANICWCQSATDPNANSPALCSCAYQSAAFQSANSGKGDCP